MQAGDRVNWTHTPRGGYGSTLPVAAVVRKVGPKRIQIEVKVREPYRKNWLSEFNWVSPASLKPRQFPSEAFEEPMELEHLGFVLTAWKHPVGNGYQAFPAGVFYGQIDGRDATVPCHSAENAVQAAFNTLSSGGYRAHLETSIELLERHLQQGVAEPDGATKLADLQARLVKLEKAFASAMQLKPTG